MTENSMDADGLPEGFWSVPDEFISDDSLRFLHAEMCARLRQENPSADTLELMMIERIATLYFYLRSSELSGDRAMRSNAAYKDMLKLFTTMASDLRKARVGAADENAIREEILVSVGKAINGAFQGVDIEVAAMAKKRIAERLDHI